MVEFGVNLEGGLHVWVLKIRRRVNDSYILNIAPIGGRTTIGVYEGAAALTGNATGERGGRGSVEDGRRSTGRRNTGGGVPGGGRGRWEWGGSNLVLLGGRGLRKRLRVGQHAQSSPKEKHGRWGEWSQTGELKLVLQ